MIIFTGKTASGKDTIIRKVLEKFPQIQKVLTTTSRTPRPGEKSEVDYHFLAKDQFEQLISQNVFIEHVEYGGNLYGTQKEDILKSLNQDLIWKIDPSRAGEVREFIRRSFSASEAERLIKQLVVIYITVDDSVVLQRLKNRGLNDLEIQKRMTDDASIWQKYHDFYDFVVENTPGKLDETVDKVIKIVESHRF